MPDSSDISARGAAGSAGDAIGDATGDVGYAGVGGSFKSGFATLVGRPNAGKSTLLNAIMGEKLAITSSTSQTTRHRFRAVYDTDDMQLVIVDTPGLHKPADALGEELNESALKGLDDVDVVCMLVDAAAPVGTGDEWVAARVARSDAEKVLVVTKTDLVGEDVVRRQLDAAGALADFDAAVALSARSGTGVAEFIDLLAGMLPVGPRWFPAGTGLDQPDEVIVAEFVREKILRLTHDEVPHAIGVATDSIERDSKTGFMHVEATVFVERESQKGIVIGKGGSLIKRIGTEARRDLERLFGCRMHLSLSVKVRRDWRRDANQVRKFGYGDSAQ